MIPTGGPPIRNGAARQLDQRGMALWIAPGGIAAAVAGLCFPLARLLGGSEPQPALEWIGRITMLLAVVLLVPALVLLYRRHATALCPKCRAKTLFRREDAGLQLTCQRCGMIFSAAEPPRGTKV